MSGDSSTILKEGVLPVCCLDFWRVPVKKRKEQLFLSNKCLIKVVLPDWRGPAINIIFGASIFFPGSIKNTARGLPGLAGRGIAALLKILRLSIDKY